ncbi:MAG: TonB-dependent receptor, partial [Pseudomonadota bacterium]
MNTRQLRIAASPCVIAAALGWSAPVLAQQTTGDEGADKIIFWHEVPQILVSAARDPRVRIEDFTGSVTVIDDQQIEQRQIRNVEDALRDVPGVAVSSIPGQTQIRLRGTEGNHVLVLVDGIEVSDPGSGEYDIGTLQAEIGSSLEVLRGPQSAVWGNDAIGGVVAYNSASGRDLEGLAAFVEGGTNNTINGSMRYGANGDGWNAALSATAVTTDGEPNARGGTRDIGRESYTVSAKGSVSLAPNFSLRAVGRFVSTQGEFNEQDFTFGSPTLGLVIDSPGTEFESEQLSGLVGARLDTLDGAWVHDLSVQFTDATRETTQPMGFPSSTQSDRFKASYVTSYDFGGSDHSLTFAADYELEGFNNVATFDFRNEVENTGFVAQYAYAGDRFDLSASVRHDINDLFEDATTFRLGAGFEATDTTRLRAAFGTGVKNPTLNELFGFFDGQFVGNPDLQPEESTSWEVGIDQGLADGLAMLSITYFNAELDNEIFTDFPPPNFIATPGNRITQSTQQGLEVALSGDLGAGFSLNAAYTFLDAEENAAEEVRRPDHIGSFIINWSDPREKASVNLALRYNGTAVDSDFTTGAFPAPTTTLSSYTLVNLNARYQLVDGLNLFGRIENLLDEEYEQVFTFVSPGINVLGGFEVR